jgi:hypothetical protein
MRDTCLGIGYNSACCVLTWYYYLCFDVFEASIDKLIIRGIIFARRHSVNDSSSSSIILVVQFSCRETKSESFGIRVQFPRCQRLTMSHPITLTVILKVGIVFLNTIIHRQIESTGDVYGHIFVTIQPFDGRSINAYQWFVVKHFHFISRGVVGSHIGHGGCHTYIQCGVESGEKDKVLTCPLLIGTSMVEWRRWYVRHQWE